MNEQPQRPTLAALDAAAERLQQAAGELPGDALLAQLARDGQAGRPDLFRPSAASEYKEVESVAEGHRIFDEMAARRGYSSASEVLEAYVVIARLNQEVQRLGAQVTVTAGYLAKAERRHVEAMTEAKFYQSLCDKLRSSRDNWQVFTVAAFLVGMVLRGWM